MSSRPRLYLASSSPRRHELLTQIGVPFEVIHPDIPEVPETGEAAPDFVIRMAREKAQAGLDLLGGAQYPCLVMGSDTSVVVDGHILGKPVDREDGLAMLERLSGRVHQVLTAVSLLHSQGRQDTVLSSSSVCFRSLSAAEREAYWQTGEPCDKAGAYAVQGLGAIFIERLEGSYSGVMGLPLFETSTLLESFGLSVLQ